MEILQSCTKPSMIYSSRIPFKRQVTLPGTNGLTLWGLGMHTCINEPDNLWFRSLMACHLLSQNPLLESMLTYYPLKTKEETSAKFLLKSNIFIPENALENAICKMAAISFQPQSAEALVGMKPANKARNTAHPHKNRQANRYKLCIVPGRVCMDKLKCGWSCCIQMGAAHQFGEVTWNARLYNANSSPPGQNGRGIAEDIFKSIPLD